MARRQVAGVAAAALTLVAGLLPACGPDPIITPVRNLERPSDMDFVCMSAADETSPSRLTGAQPMPVCKDPARPDPAPGSIRGIRILGTFGLVTNSARSEVGAIDLEFQRLVDLDPGIPGFNQIPVGALPESISTSDDGCRAVTANRGSCDLSFINTSRALAPVMKGTVHADDTAPIVTTFRIKTGRGELRAAPYEIAFLPTLSAEQAYPTEPLSGLPDGGTSTPVMGTDAGTDAGLPTMARRAPACGTAPGQTWRAVVTFPSCDLVAMVRFGLAESGLPEARVLSSVRILPDGQVVNAGPDPVCAADCPVAPGTDGGGAADVSPDLPAADAGDVAQSDGALDPGPADAGAADAGISDAAGPVTTVDAATPRTGVLGVGALAVMPRGDRVYLAATRSEQISVVGIGPGDTGFLALPDAPVRLAERPGGVTRLRLTANRFGPPKPGGPFVGDRGQYLYAFARDGSVRVVEIGDGKGNLLSSPGECDVNVDPDRPGFNPARGCVRVTEKFPRLLLEKGPGLRVPVRLEPDVGAPVPIDIAFSELGPLGLGLLLASNGQVYQIAVDPLLASGMPAHTPRGSAPSAGSRAGGPPRVEEAPTRSFTETTLPYPTKVGFASEDLGPRLESYSTSAQGSSSSQVTNWMKFEEHSAVPEDVLVRWEGTLPGTDRLTGQLSAAASGAPLLRDVGADYCRAAVEPGDVLSISGCDQDTQCDPNADEVCYRIAPGAQGTCLPRSFVANEPLVRACRTELASRRRYEIHEVRKRQLVLGLKLDEVPRPRLAPCTVVVASGAPDVCQPDAAHLPDPTLPDDKGFRCMELVAGEPRCLKSCGVKVDGVWQPSDERCRPGHVCADVGSADLGPLCVEAPLPRPECTPRDARYQIQAGKSYLVRSQALPYFATHREQAVEPNGDPGAGGLCVRDTTAPKLFSQRISLNAPRCQNVMDGTRASGAIEHRTENEPFGGNPCMFRGPNEEPETGSHVKALFQTPHYRFVLTNIEDYVGDAATIRVFVVGGFSPLIVASPSRAVIGLGARIVTGPSDADDTGVSIDEAANTMPVPPPFFFVVDQGRTLTQFSRGQVLRINPRPLDTLQGGFLDSIETDSLFPIQ
jgi:hypothetical protein